MVNSVLADNVEVRENATHCRGMFAKTPISKGDIVFIKGGHILKKEQIFSSAVINSYQPISDDYFIGALNKEEECGIKLYINHSCSPNCGLRGEITFVAIRDIAADEELLIDYAFVDNEDYTFECSCGSENCRKTVTGYDWKIKDIQQKYFDYFSLYLKEKILSQEHNESEVD